MPIAKFRIVKNVIVSIIAIDLQNADYGYIVSPKCYLAQDKITSFLFQFDKRKNKIHTFLKFSKGLATNSPQYTHYKRKGKK